MAAAVVALSSATATAGDLLDVLQLKYTDGVIDYIPVSELNKLSTIAGIEIDRNSLYDINVMFDRMKNHNTGSHNSFGYAALMLGMDLAGHDIYTVYGSYNWFNNWARFMHETGGAVSSLMWSNCYYYIRTANQVLQLLPNLETDEGKLMAAQALALRSFAYWNLVQTYAPNVSVAPDAKAVVIIDDTSQPNTDPYPLSTTTEVYEKILADINLAIEYLKDNAYEPALFDIAFAKRYIDLSVAYGLRARYNLTMHRYADAARDARAAIDCSSARPLLPDAAAYPGFNDARLGNWMWTVPVNPNDNYESSTKANYSSFISTFSSDGYTSIGIARACGDQLWAWLSSQPDDVRNYWFLDNENKGAHLTATQQKVATAAARMCELPHVNIKFDVYKSKVLGKSHNVDVPLMRIEEMYLIEAEGLAMSGDLTAAREKLNDFVRTYRNPSYTCTGADTQAIQNEVLWQRRIELWGEGLSFFDTLRLQLDIDRSSSNLNWSFVYKIRGGSDFMLYKYPNTFPYIEGYDYGAEVALPVNGNDWNE